jgi:hypothetical protein
MTRQGDEDASPNPEPAKKQQPAVISSNRENSQSNAGNQTKQTNNVPPDGDASFKRPKWMSDPNWWLVIVAGLTGCVICWQSWETRKAARGADKSFEVALAQIQMMKSKERPRVSVEIGTLEVNLIGPEFWIATVVVKIFNFGETKAFVSASEGVFILGQSAEPLKEKFPDALIAESVIHPTTNPLEKAFSLFDQIGADTIWQLNTEERFAHLNGFVEYSDVSVTSIEPPFDISGKRTGGYSLRPQLCLEVLTQVGLKLFTASGKRLGAKQTMSPTRQIRTLPSTW